MLSKWDCTWRFAPSPAWKEQPEWQCLAEAVLQPVPRYFLPQFGFEGLKLPKSYTPDFIRASGLGLVGGNPSFWAGCWISMLIASGQWSHSETSAPRGLAESRLLLAHSPISKGQAGHWCCRDSSITSRHRAPSHPPNASLGRSNANCCFPVSSRALSKIIEWLKFGKDLQDHELQPSPSACV